MKYLINSKVDLKILRSSQLNTEQILTSIERFNDTIEKFHAFDINISEILGMRNLSSFVGEVFVHSLEAESNALLKRNPHQDGYPDLLLMDKEGKQLWDSLSGREQEKKPFSPFVSGGIEVKATCGSVPTPTECQRKGFSKPIMGEQRIKLLKGYDWKAHHQETNRLIGLVWDFINKKPTIVGLFYSSTLDDNDWGGIIQPRKGGGRTTSVSIMTRLGVKKMYESWVAILNDEEYINFFNKYNNDKLIS